MIPGVKDPDAYPAWSDVSINDPIGYNAYEHLYFLRELRERTQSLRKILQEVIKPGMSVLDIGTGTLGNLTITAAQLGATRVVGVDVGPLNIAAAIAKQNNANIEFVQSNILELDLRGEKFDIILGSLYLHEPWGDNKSNAFKRCAEKFGTDETILIPSQVTYEATGYGFDVNKQSRLMNDIDLVEQDSGIDLSLLRNVNHPHYRKFLYDNPAPRIIGDEYDTFAEYTSLSAPSELASIDYRDLSYNPLPTEVLLEITNDGFLSFIKWGMITRYNEHVVRDHYITKFGSPSRIKNPKKVKAGDFVKVLIPNQESWSMSKGAVEIE